MERRFGPSSMAQGLESARSEYAIARDNRFRRKRPGVSSVAKTADQHFPSESAFIQSREYVRDMVMNDPAIGPLVEMAVTQTVQDGFSPDPKSPDAELNKRLKDEWQEYAEDPEQIDIAGEHDFVDMQINGFRAMLVDGDGLAAGTDTGAIQMFEAHRLRTPRSAAKSKKNIVYGVQLDDLRRRNVFWLAKEGVDIGPGKYDRFSDFEQLDARDENGTRQVFHFYNCRRVTQTRGVTALAAVADLASNVDDTTFAQLIKTQFAAMVVGFLQRNGDYIADSQMGERKSSILPDGTTQMIEQLAAGMFLRGHKGEELKIQSGNVNTQETLDFLRYMLQIISLNLGMPLILGLLDASRSNMSSARVDLDSARMGFRKNQREFVRRFHRPLWRWWLLRKCFTEKSWAKQYERHGPALLRCHWETPRWPFIDPWKDVNSNALKLSTMQSSPRRVLADAGLKHGVIVDETVEDRFEQWDKAFVGWKKLIALHPEAKDVLTVRDMLNLDLYKGGQVIDSAEVDNDGGDAQTKRKTA